MFKQWQVFFKPTEKSIRRIKLLLTVVSSEARPTDTEPQSIRTWKVQQAREMALFKCDIVRASLRTWHYVYARLICNQMPLALTMKLLILKYNCRLQSTIIASFVGYPLQKQHFIEILDIIRRYKHSHNLQHAITKCL